MKILIKCLPALAINLGVLFVYSVVYYITAPIVILTNLLTPVEYLQILALATFGCLCLTNVLCLKKGYYKQINNWMFKEESYE